MSEPSVGAGADRVLYVLATLARHDGPLTIAALAEKTGLAQSTLYRQVALLKRWGFVAEHEGEYGPGPLCVQLAWGFDQSSFLIHEAQPDMATLAAASGETIGLLVAVKDQAVCLDMIESQHPLRCSFTKGRGLPLARGASAKSLLAFMPLGRLQAALAYLADEAGVDPSRLEDELERIRGQGYAVTDSEVDAGVWGVSVPIFQRPNQAVASITLMAPSTRAAQRPDALIAMTVAAARRISDRLKVH
ncbi:IclR family transcriptional regulator [Achromobacter sp. LC458]|uniref:IclR family transcriptional regulator n=1 Tax=Achromobacter spanius TaxID=217203 RepID=A0A2S5GJC9_9BURK|nr:MULTISPECIES: IclR family transcriptional regulator [Achromobacter]MDX3984179.1 IclR family transcriptional regulator [Achromobacter sp.]PPA73005.1 IclR family transcriptional regulator [Achromobacter spanius]QYJ23820.1 IclR family transcriptional regulator [Achromobacter sp. ES-001]TRM50122.1 IclR family transcriptional regulator [Achromobacter sp. LC458]HCQ49749.1 IclR family transcriptional regulator [Achromobacter sp.]